MHEYKLPTLNKKSSELIFGVKDSYRAYVALTKPAGRVGTKTHHQVIKEFGKKIMDAILYKSYVFKIPNNLGSIYIGEELSKRKYIKTLKRQEDGSVKLILIPNTGLRKVFRLHWDKDSCKNKHKTFYHFYTEKTPRRMIGRYIEEVNSNLEKKNFRAIPIL